MILWARGSDKKAWQYNRARSHKECHTLTDRHPHKPPVQTHEQRLTSRHTRGFVQSCWTVQYTYPHDAGWERGQQPLAVGGQPARELDRSRLGPNTFFDGRQICCVVNLGLLKKEMRVSPAGGMVQGFLLQLSWEQIKGTHTGAKEKCSNCTSKQLVI